MEERAAERAGARAAVAKAEARAVVEKEVEARAEAAGGARAAVAHVLPMPSWRAYSDGPGLPTLVFSHFSVCESVNDTSVND